MNGAGGAVGPNKAIAAGLSGAATIVVVWGLGKLHVDMPAEVASALTTLVAAGFAWLIPHGGAG